MFLTFFTSFKIIIFGRHRNTTAPANRNQPFRQVTEWLRDRKSPFHIHMSTWHIIKCQMIKLSRWHFTAVRTKLTHLEITLRRLYNIHRYIPTCLIFIVYMRKEVKLPLSWWVYLRVAEKPHWQSITSFMLIFVSRSRNVIKRLSLKLFVRMQLRKLVHDILLI